MGHLNTCRRAGARARARVLAALALAAGLAHAGTAHGKPAAASRRGATAAPEAPGVVFFWSSASPTDAAVRGTLGAAVDAAAGKVGAPSIDLSPPAPPAPALGEQVAHAIAAYDAMRFADAIAELDLAAAAATEHGARGLERDALVDLFLYRGLSRSEAGDTAAAWNDFVRAAALDPARVLDPARFRPSAIKSFTRAVDEVKVRPLVPLAVTAPAGSHVHIDGRDTGREQVSESLAPGEHYVWVDRPAAPPYARTVTLASATTIEVPEEAAVPPDDADLGRRAARFGAGPALLVALRRDGGVALVELRAIGPRGGAPRGVVRLGPSPEANARDLQAAVARALRQQATQVNRPGAMTPQGRGGERTSHWYQSRWLWLAIGAASAVIVVSPFLLDSGGSPAQAGAGIDTGALEQ